MEFQTKIIFPNNTSTSNIAPKNLDSKSMTIISMPCFDIFLIPKLEKLELVKNILAGKHFLLKIVHQDTNQIKTNLIIKI